MLSLGNILRPFYFRLNYFAEQPNLCLFMKLLCVSYFLLFSLIANSQKLLKGVVLDEVKKQPIIKAIVFLNGTTISTSTNEQGGFILNIPNGRHALVTISPKFQTHYEIINSNELPGFDTIKLKGKAISPTNAGPYEKNGWEEWGNFFMINFIGSSVNALDCKIKNLKAIHFQNEDDELSAFADEPLIIENKALGYTIEYKLESFHCNFKTQSLRYAGYSFFVPMSGNTTKQQKWERKRSEAYFGSMMHFMRSVYRNQIAEEGFDVRALQKVRNITYQTNQTDSNDSHLIKTKDSNMSTSDSVDDYNDQILNADNYKDVIGTTLIGDSIAYAIDKTTAGLAFNNFLLVIYKGQETSIEYQQQNGGTGMTSQLILINRRPIEIEANGSYYDPRDLLVLGYWTWSEKIANMLPFDYNPPKQ